LREALAHRAAVFVDRDGSVTGNAGGSCTFHPEWNAYACSNRYVGFSLRSDAEVIAPVTLTRDDAAALTLVGVPGYPNTAYASMVPGRGYTVQYAGEEWVRVTLPYPQPTFRVIRDYNSSQPLVAAASLAELDASTGDRYFYDGVTGLIHLKLVTKTGRDWVTGFVEPQ
jgi:hypothetical protein